jgi:hypothetical protein
VATYAIVVDCAANGGFSATSNVSAGNFTINKSNQNIGTITFTPATLAVSGTTTASATATSGLPVTFSSDTLSVCTVSGNVVTGVSAGTCTIRAAQAGDGNYNAATDVTQPLTVTGGATTATLTVVINGSGTGTINSDPSGLITCPGDCSETFATVPTTVTLKPVPSSNSDFSWGAGNDCTSSGSGDCVLTMDSDKTITATFTPKPLVKMPGDVYYSSIQEACNAASAGYVVEVRDQTFNEDVTFSNPANMTFEGGNDASWNVVGYTTIRGTVTLNGGTVTISNVIVE